MIASDLPGFQAFQYQFTRHILNPGEHARPNGVPAKRMRVYNEIVFNNMEATLAACFPVCKRVLGVRCWQRLVRAFLAQHRCATPLFRQIPEEFLQYLEDVDSSPAYLYSLAHYEWIELALAMADVALDSNQIDDQADLLDGIPVLAPALALLNYDYPVHRISPRHKPTQPLAVPVSLLVFRDAGDDVQFIELNPVSARLLALLQAGEVAGRAALLQVACELGHAQPEQVVMFGAGILDDLRRRGVILGASRCK